MDTSDSDFLDPASHEPSSNYLETSSQMETYPAVSESFLPPADHQPFSSTLVATSLTATSTGIIQQTTSTSTSFLSTPEPVLDFPRDRSNRDFTTTSGMHPVCRSPNDDCNGDCHNRHTDIVTTSHLVASLLSTSYPSADPAIVDSAVNAAIGLLERDGRRREYPRRQWTPSPVPLFRPQGISEPLPCMLRYRQLLTL